MSEIFISLLKTVWAQQGKKPVGLNRVKMYEFLMDATKCSINSFSMAVYFDSNLITALLKKLLHILKLKPSYRKENDESRKMIQIYKNQS